MNADTKTGRFLRNGLNIENDEISGRFKDINQVKCLLQLFGLNIIRN
jgi:hypothetical protein